MRHGSINYDKEVQESRFTDKIDKSGDCWLWIGNKIKAGYGTIQRDGKRFYAHRVSYETYVGPIPAGTEIDHLCRVRHCVKPEHLEAVSHKVNTERGIGPTAVNAAKTHCIRNHPLSGENLYIVAATGYRQCKRCMDIRRKKVKTDDSQ